MFIFNHLISCLKNNQENRIEQLAQQLSLSPSDLINKLKKEQQFGLPFDFDEQKIYLTNQKSLLNIENLNNALSEFSVKYFPVIGSTNDYLLQHHRNLPHLTLCLTDYQTQGRGQRGRQWHMSFGGQLTFSLLYRLKKTQDLAGLSLAVGISLVKTLHRLGLHHVGIKWPNDLMVNDHNTIKKLAGILIESVGNFDEYVNVVIGVGINYSPILKQIDKPSISLSQLSQNFSREEFLIALLQDLKFTLDQFNQQGFSAFQHLWKTFDIFYEKNVFLHNEQSQIYGKNLGVTSQGALRVLTVDGIKHIYQGSYSLKAE